jgi:hypothetical protein
MNSQTNKLKVMRMHTNYLCESQIEEMKFNVNHELHEFTRILF